MAEKFNPDMLRLARDAREATQADLAIWSGVTQALISKIENRLTVPSADVVEKIALALRLPVSFFMQEERTIGFPPFHYRKRVRLGAKALARIGAWINIRRQHIAKLLCSYEVKSGKPIPQYDLDETGLTPEQIAERLRSYWLLPRGPVESMVQLIEKAGGIVVPCRFDTNLLDAVSFRSADLPPLFFMNRDMPGDRFRFSLAHELAHVVMHNIPGDDQEMEEEADRFAASFLMPATDIRPYFKEMKISSIGRLKPYWKVSIKALIKRAYDLKLMTDHQYKMLNIQYNTAFKQGETPFEFPQEQPSTLRGAVSYHLENLGYSPQELAKSLYLADDDTQVIYGDGPKLRVVK